MKIQELRIGNYILDEGEFATVELINGETEEVFYKE
jgi:tRNA G37 N-methylase TrmD